MFFNGGQGLGVSDDLGTGPVSWFVFKKGGGGRFNKEADGSEEEKRELAGKKICDTVVLGDWTLGTLKPKAPYGINK